MNAAKLVEPLGFGTSGDTADDMAAVLVGLQGSKSLDVVYLHALTRIHHQILEVRERFRSIDYLEVGRRPPPDVTEDAAVEPVF